ncbi:MAG: hypothetical protein ACKVS6_00655 [Planctomycetota bacterium]
MNAFAALFSTLSILAFAGAPASFGQSTAGPRPVDPPTSNTSIQRFLAENEPRFVEFTRRHSGSWLPKFDEHSHAPVSVVGTGIIISPRSIATISEAKRFAGEFLNSESYFWGAPVTDLKLTNETAAGPLFIFTWQQYFDGLEVLGGRVDIQIHRAGRIALIGTSAIPIASNIRDIQSLTADQTIAIVRNGKRLSPVDSIDVTDLAIFPVRKNGEVEPRLVFVITVKQPSMRVAERVLVDAENGNILEVRSLIHNTGQTHGTVTGSAYLGLSPVSGAAVAPIPGATVTVTSQTGQQASVVTDANGNYSVDPGGAAPFSATLALSGPSYQILDANGNNISVTIAGAADGQGGFLADLDANPNITEGNLAQVTAAVLHSRVRDYIISILPAYAAAFPQQKVVVNIAAACNAYFDTSDGSINFFQSGGGCVNTAYGTVIDHEVGHGVDAFFGNILSPSYSEGIADVVAMFHTKQAIVGQDFGGPGTSIRTGENSVTWPAAGCFFEPHCVGETYMGFGWQARKLLIQSLGETAGATVAENLILNVLPANPFSIPMAVQQSFLLDDDDGNLTNGTPHFNELSAAALMKGFTPPAPTGLSILHIPHPDTAGQTRDYPIIIDMITEPGFAVSTVKVLYSDNDLASWNTLFASPTAVAGRYKTEIPAHAAPAVIHYGIIATNTAGGTIDSPAGDDAYRFAVGAKTTILFEDFESGAPGWTHGALLGSDQWQIADPSNSNVANSMLDPSAAYSGSKIAGTDLSVSSTDGLYEPDSDIYLDSPPLDLSNISNARLRFRRWLSVEGSQYDFSTVSLKGGASGTLYTNPWQPELIDTSWTLQDLPAAGAGGIANVQFRFELATDGGLEFGGWNIDDVEVYSITPTPAGNFTLSVNNQFPLIGSELSFISTGDPGAYFEIYISGNAGPIAVEGFGVAEVGADAIFFYNGTLDTNGQHSLPVVLPYDPVLIGFELHVVGYEQVPGGLPQLGNSVKIIIS